MTISFSSWRPSNLGAPREGGSGGSAAPPLLLSRFLLSLGDDECRFAVLEADDPLAGYTDTLNQRFVDKQESA
jgi:hypothetical protein